MKTLRKLPDGRWVIFRRPLNRRMGYVLIGVGLALAVLAATLDREGLSYMWIQALFFGVPGSIYIWTDKRAVVDAEVGFVDLGQGPLRGRDFVAVRLGSKVRGQRNEKVRLYSVGLTRPEIEPGTNTPAEISLTLTPSEADAWKIGELLANAFDLPILDASDDRLTQRSPTQLDQPLGERLASTSPSPKDPGPAPPGMSQRSSPGRLHLAWRAPMTDLAASLAVLAAMLVLSLWLALGAVDVPEVGLPVSALMLVISIAVVIAARGLGGNELEISAGVLHHTSRFPCRRVKSLPLSKLEHARKQSNPMSMVSLVSDDGVTVLRGSMEQCEWILRKLEHWLAANASGHQGS